MPWSRPLGWARTRSSVAHAFSKPRRPRSALQAWSRTRPSRTFQAASWNEGATYARMPLSASTSHHRSPCPLAPWMSTTVVTPLAISSASAWRIAARNQRPPSRPGVSTSLFQNGPLRVYIGEWPSRGSSTSSRKPVARLPPLRWAWVLIMPGMTITPAPSITVSASASLSPSPTARIPDPSKTTSQFDR